MERSVDVLLEIWTRGRGMVGGDDTTKLGNATALFSTTVC